MSVVETLEGLKRRINIKLDIEKVENEITNRLQNLSKRVRIDGFRPGKVPLKTVRNMHGKQVEYEVINDMVSEQYREIMKENSAIKPANYPEIYPVENNKYEFNADFEVMPEFSIQGLNQLKATKLEATVENSDIDNMIETLQKQQVIWNIVDREAKDKDRLKIDFVGRKDGVEFDGGKGSDVPLVLGSKAMIPGFEEALIGVKKGDTRTIQVTFPEDYQSDDLKGKDAEFDVTVYEVAEPILPELNEDFAKGFGVEDGDITKLREELKKNMSRELENVIHNRFKNTLMKSLAELNSIEVPQALINSEIQNMARQANFPEPKNQEQIQQLMQIATKSFGEEAAKRAKLALVVSQLIEEEKIELKDEYVEKQLQNLAATYEDPEDVIEHFKKDDQSMRSIRNIALEDQIVDFLAEKAEITIEKSCFADIMTPKHKS